MACRQLKSVIAKLRGRSRDYDVASKVFWPVTESCVRDFRFHPRLDEDRTNELCCVTVVSSHRNIKQFQSSRRGRLYANFFFRQTLNNGRGG
jgi:hypothetical protein